MSINSTSDLQAKYENDYIHRGTCIEEHFKSKSCNNVCYDQSFKWQMVENQYCNATWNTWEYTVNDIMSVLN